MPEFEELYDVLRDAQDAGDITNLNKDWDREYDMEDELIRERGEYTFNYRNHEVTVREAINYEYEGLVHSDRFDIAFKAPEGYVYDTAFMESARDYFHPEWLNLPHYQPDFVKDAGNYVIYDYEPSSNRVEPEELLDVLEYMDRNCPLLKLANLHGVQGGVRMVDGELHFHSIDSRQHPQPHHLHIQQNQLSLQLPADLQITQSVKDVVAQPFDKAGIKQIKARLSYDTENQLVAQVDMTGLHDQVKASLIKYVTQADLPLENFAQPVQKQAQALTQEDHLNTVQSSVLGKQLKLDVEDLNQLIQYTQ